MRKGTKISFALEKIQVCIMKLKPTPPYGEYKAGKFTPLTKVEIDSTIQKAERDSVVFGNNYRVYTWITCAFSPSREMIGYSHVVYKCGMKGTIGSKNNVVGYVNNGVFVPVEDKWEKQMNEALLKLSPVGQKLHEAFLVSRKKHPEVSISKGFFGIEIQENTEDNTYDVFSPTNRVCPLGAVMLDAKAPYVDSERDEYMELLNAQVPELEREYFEGFWRGFDRGFPVPEVFYSEYSKYVDTEGFKDGQLFREAYGYLFEE